LDEINGDNRYAVGGFAAATGVEDAKHSIITLRNYRFFNQAVHFSNGFYPGLGLELRIELNNQVTASKDGCDYECDDKNCSVHSCIYLIVKHLSPS